MKEFGMNKFIGKVLQKYTCIRYPCIHVLVLYMHKGFHNCYNCRVKIVSSSTKLKASAVFALTALNSSMT